MYCDIQLYCLPALGLGLGLGRLTTEGNNEGLQVYRYVAMTDAASHWWEDDAEACRVPNAFPAAFQLHGVLSTGGLPEYNLCRLELHRKKDAAALKGNELQTALNAGKYSAVLPIQKQQARGLALMNGITSAAKLQARLNDW